jgi:hypothetical protein
MPQANIIWCHHQTLRIAEAVKGALLEAATLPDTYDIVVVGHSWIKPIIIQISYDIWEQTAARIESVPYEKIRGSLILK